MGIETKREKYFRILKVALAAGFLWGLLAFLAWGLLTSHPEPSGMAVMESHHAFNAQTAIVGGWWFGAPGAILFGIAGGGNVERPRELYVSPQQDFKEGFL